MGNPGTGDIIDYSSRVPYAHGVGIISDQLYEVINSLPYAYSSGATRLFGAYYFYNVMLFCVYVDDIGALPRTGLL